jgi:hypothetical protein
MQRTKIWRQYEPIKYISEISSAFHDELYRNKKQIILSVYLVYLKHNGNYIHHVFAVHLLNILLTKSMYLLALFCKQTAIIFPNSNHSFLKCRNGVLFRGSLSAIEVS